MQNYLDHTFLKLQLIFYKKYKKVQNDERIYLQLKNMKQRRMKEWKSIMRDY